MTMPLSGCSVLIEGRSRTMVLILRLPDIGEKRGGSLYAMLSVGWLGLRLERDLSKQNKDRIRGSWEGRNRRFFFDHTTRLHSRQSRMLTDRGTYKDRDNLLFNIWLEDFNGETMALRRISSPIPPYIIIHIANRCPA